MSATTSVLIAEDDETDVFFLQRAFQKAEFTYPVTFVPDGMAAIELLSRAKTKPEERLPALVVLDLKMPRRNGLQVLEWMRTEPVIRAIPVLIFSSSANESDIELAYEAGASGFMIKPPSSAERMEMVSFLKSWLRLIQPPLTASHGFKAALSFRAPLGSSISPVAVSADGFPASGPQ